MNDIVANVLMFSRIVNIFLLLFFYSLECDLTVRIDDPLWGLHTVYVQYDEDEDVS